MSKRFTKLFHLIFCNNRFLTWFLVKGEICILRIRSEAHMPTALDPFFAVWWAITKHSKIVDKQWHKCHAHQQIQQRSRPYPPTSVKIVPLDYLPRIVILSPCDWHSYPYPFSYACPAQSLLGTELWRVSREEIVPAWHLILLSKYLWSGEMLHFSPSSLVSEVTPRANLPALQCVVGKYLTFTSDGIYTPPCLAHA